MVEKGETWKRQKQFLKQLPSAFIILWNMLWKRMTGSKVIDLKTNRLFLQGYESTSNITEEESEYLDS